MKPPLEEQNDEDLVHQAKQGSLEAFEGLFARHHPAVFRLAYRLCGNEEEASDIAQESFVKAARGIRGFKEKSAFKSWLWRIAINTAKDFKRREKRKDEQLAKIESQQTSSEQLGKYIADEQEKDTHARVLQALDKLSPEQRSAIVLTVYEGLSHKEAAEASGCSTSTLSWRIFRAKAKLKDELKDLDAG
jgi:RNA polymerase sigma-70 factor (ECF subfamily)